MQYMPKHAIQANTIKYISIHNTCKYMQIHINTYQYIPYIPIYAFVLNSQYKPNTYSIHWHTKHVLGMYWALNTNIGIQYKPIHTGKTTEAGRRRAVGARARRRPVAVPPPSGNPTPSTSPPFLVICLLYAYHTNTSFISFVDLSYPCHILVIIKL